MLVEPPILKNICSSNWIISPGRGKNKKCLKAPPRYCFTKTLLLILYHQTERVAKNLGSSQIMSPVVRCTIFKQHHLRLFKFSLSKASGKLLLGSNRWRITSSWAKGSKPQKDEFFRPCIPKPRPTISVDNSPNLVISERFFSILGDQRPSKKKFQFWNSLHRAALSAFFYIP